MSEMALTSLASAAETVMTSVSYGDGPVVQDDARQQVRLGFQGGAGDLVRLALKPGNGDGSQIVLSGPQGVVPPRPDGLWELPAADTYTFAYSPGARGFARQLQLEKVSVIDVPVDGTPVLLGRTRGFVTAARITVPATDSLCVRPTMPDPHREMQVWSDLIDPSGATRSIDCYHRSLILSVGEPLIAGFDNLDLTVTTGDYLLFAREQVTIQVDQVACRTIAPEGAQSASVTFDATPGDRSQQLAFTGRAGEVMCLRLPDLSAWDRLLVTPEGRVHRNLLPGAWRLPHDGDYRLFLIPTSTHRSPEPVTADLFTAEPLRKIPVSAPITLAVAEAGRYLVAPLRMRGDGTSYVAHTSNSTFPGDWRIAIAPPEDYDSDLYLMAGGCEAHTRGLGADNPTSGPMSGPRGEEWVFLLEVPAGHTGSVDVTISRH